MSNDAMANETAAKRRKPHDPRRLIYIADLAGTFVFGIEGALAAIANQLDMFGVLALSFVTALGGGVVRDLLIAAAPPAALRDWRYPAFAFSAGALTFVLHTLTAHIAGPVIIVLDAAGLALFAVAGTEKALAYKIHPAIATLMGMLTGCGGGVLRDMLLAQVPRVLRIDIYATAALFGSVVMVVLQRLGLRPYWAALLGGGACFALRLVAVSQNWQLPKVTTGL
jgi:uncharacterized membrane protein YeiH